MGIFSEAHVCQCLSRLATQKHNSLVTTSGGRQKTSQQFVESILSLALGLRNGDVAISAFNSFFPEIFSFKLQLHFSVAEAVRQFLFLAKSSLALSFVDHVECEMLFLVFTKKAFIDISIRN
ncbi:hypothetical protein V6N13_011019 [Hibiscus sabdariffa]|uniref:Uncharacterized protein n=1 Tax=Hibiscus sabdariffa TaxID=183260 RepID=A0ABR2SBL5_9ROSI